MAQKHIRFDWAIKRLLRDKANFEILEGFLSELLFQDIKIQEILESEGNQESETSKFNRVDILVKDKNDSLMLIEVQNEKQDDYFHRMLFGQAKLFSERIKICESYGSLNRVYSINIVYFKLGQGDDYIYVSDGSFRGMHLQDVLQLSEKQKEMYKVQEVRDIFTKYYLLKVNNFDDYAKDELDQWIYFLKNSEIKDSFSAKGLEKAKEVLRIDNLSPQDREEYDIFEKFERIRESEIITAESDGYYKAKLELEPMLGEERRQKEEVLEKLKKLVIKMHQKGISVETIAADLEMETTEVKEILKDQNSF